MRLLLFSALAPALLILLRSDGEVQSAPDVKIPPLEGRRIVGYFIEWGIYQQGYHVANIPAEKLTHINYAFARITPQGEIGLFDSFAAIDKAYPGDRWDPPTTLRGNFNQLAVLKKKHPHLKALISVGGWTLSSPFSEVARTPEGRVRFAKSCAGFVARYGFDGVDVDWEYPVGGGLESNQVRPEDRANYPLLLAALRKELDAQGTVDRKRYLLTIAGPAGPKTLANFDLAAMTPSLDWYNVMAYDFHGGWDKQTGFNAPLHADPKDPRDAVTSSRLNVDATVKAWLAAGVPADRIVLGVPFYGRGWGGVPDRNNGLYQPAKNAPPKGTRENGVWDWKDISANYVGKMARHRHPDTRVPWLFDPGTGVMISYEDPESITAKAEFIVSRKLGGAMIWELSGDDPKASLLDALQAVLRPGKPAP